MTNNYRDTRITLHRRMMAETSAMTLLSATEERLLAQRIDTARRSLLAALAAWPGCVPRLLADYAHAALGARQRERLILGFHGRHPDDCAGMLATTARIAAHLSQVEMAYQRYMNSLIANGWAHEQTRRQRRDVAALLSTLQLHEHCLRQLLALTALDTTIDCDLPTTAMRTRIAAARHALESTKQRMVSANLRLVASVARRYRYCAVPQVDLIQEGNIGLLRAVEKFDHRRGCKFSTYAIWWIQRAMVLTITLQRSTLSVPAYALQAAHRAQRRTAQAMLAGDPAASIEELAAIESMPAADLRAAYAACLPAVALHGETDDETAPINTLRDSQQPDPADILMQSQLRQELHAILTKLPARQAHVLRLRFGIGVDEPYTLDAIGRQLGLSRERIRQIEQQALQQLRHGVHRSTLATLLDDGSEWHMAATPVESRAQGNPL